MLHTEPLTRLVADLSGRSPDQHAVDPVTAAAQIPTAASRLRHARHELTLAVDALRTTLINGDDLKKETTHAVAGHLATISEQVRLYQAAREKLDTLLDDDERERYAAHTPPRRVERRYVNLGDTVTVVLPHTETCLALRLAGRRTRLTVWGSDTELDLTVGPGQLRLSHHDAGIYYDPTTARLYVVQVAGDTEHDGPESHHAHC